MPTAECFSIDVVPGLSRLFLDYCAGSEAARPFFASLPGDPGWQTRPAVPAHWPQLVSQLAAQNLSPAAAGFAAALFVFFLAAAAFLLLGMGSLLDCMVRKSLPTAASRR